MVPLDQDYSEIQSDKPANDYINFDEVNVILDANGNNDDRMQSTYLKNASHFLQQLKEERHNLQGIIVALTNACTIRYSLILSRGFG
jgi:hypothetical protein